MIYFFRKKKFEIYFVILFLFSLVFNQYFGNRGLSPLDSSGLFGGGYRVLNGDFPFKDYWVTTGPFIDYFQGLARSKIFRTRIALLLLELFISKHDIPCLIVMNRRALRFGL